MPSVMPTRATSTRPLFPFLASHSLLIGLIPFFVPVWLWQSGIRVAGLSILIGASGFAFCVALTLWQRLALKAPLRWMIAISFALELLLISLIALTSSAELTNASIGIPLLIGLANGFYNAFFWTTQRVLFAQSLGQNDTGKRYGNFQIFVALFLKAGILIGGLLLDVGGLPWLLAMSTAVALSSALWLGQPSYAEPLHTLKPTIEPTTLLQGLKFRDGRGSRPTFAIDGFFLYLESHFWTVSLFLIVGEDFSRLGAVVVVLAIVFAALFWLIKNLIDSLVGETVYRVSVALYAVSWLLRAWVDEELADSVQLVALILITFCSSFFRLTFNKRFFDIARNEGINSYLLNKSYASQWWLGAGFLSIGVTLMALEFTEASALMMTYIPAAALSLTYLRYQVR